MISCVLDTDELKPLPIHEIVSSGFQTQYAFCRVVLLGMHSIRRSFVPPDSVSTVKHTGLSYIAGVLIHGFGFLKFAS